MSDVTTTPHEPQPSERSRVPWTRRQQFCLIVTCISTMLVGGVLGWVTGNYRVCEDKNHRSFWPTRETRYSRQAVEITTMLVGAAGGLATGWYWSVRVRRYLLRPDSTFGLGLFVPALGGAVAGFLVAAVVVVSITVVRVCYGDPHAADPLKSLDFHAVLFGLPTGLMLGLACAGMWLPWVWAPRRRDRRASHTAQRTNASGKSTKE